MMIPLLIAAAASLAPNTMGAQKTISGAVNKQIAQDMASNMPSNEGAAAAVAGGSSQEVMLITPLDRANDILQAYNYLKQNSIASSVSVMMKDKSMFSNILDVQIMKNGTLIIFKLSTLQGERYRLVKTEDIDSLVVS
jgi:hypothetical protein